MTLRNIPLVVGSVGSTLAVNAAIRASNCPIDPLSTIGVPWNYFILDRRSQLRKFWVYLPGTGVEECYTYWHELDPHRDAAPEVYAAAAATIHHYTPLRSVG